MGNLVDVIKNIKKTNKHIKEFTDNKEIQKMLLKINNIDCEIETTQLNSRLKYQLFKNYTVMDRKNKDIDKEKKYLNDCCYNSKLIDLFIKRFKIELRLRDIDDDILDNFYYFLMDK